MSASGLRGTESLFIGLEQPCQGCKPKVSVCYMRQTNIPRVTLNVRGDKSLESWREPWRVGGGKNVNVELQGQSRHSSVQFSRLRFPPVRTAIANLSLHTGYGYVQGKRNYCTPISLYSDISIL